MEMNDLIKGMLKKQSDFAYYGDLDLSVWGFAPIGVHRDSDLMTQSNFAYALKELRKVSYKSVEVMHTSHCLVGWYDHLMVRVTAKKTMERLMEIVERLEDYPVLDEDDLSNREYEQACNAYDSWARSDVAKAIEEAGIERLLDGDGYYDPSDEDEETVKNLLVDNILEHDSFEGTYDMPKLISAIEEAFKEVSQNLTLDL